MADEKETGDETQKESDKSRSGDETEKGKEASEVGNTAPSHGDASTSNDQGQHVTRDEFRELVGSVTKLTETVGNLADKLADSTPLGSDSKPVKRPWTHIGSRVHDGN